MIRFPLFVLALLATLCGLGLFASPAIAAPPCSSYAGMANQDRDGFCAFVGAATATTSGWTGKVDCDDEDATVFPGAHEIVDDGIDQDCDGVDMALSISDPAFARYVANSYGGKAPNKETFVMEYDRCDDATGRCTVNDPKGRFDITDPEKDILCDVHINGGSVMGSDGIREVVTLEVASHRFPGVKAGDKRCGANGSTQGSAGSSSSSSAAPKSSGIGRATATKIADASAAKAVKAEAELRAKADGALSERLDKADELDEAQTVAINAASSGLVQLEVALAAQEDALVAEARLRASEDERLDRIVGAARRDADSAFRLADVGSRHGPLFEAGIVGGGIFHRPLNTSEGDPVRGVGIGGGGFELRAGVDASRVQVAGFGQFSFGSDGLGTGPDTSLLIGADVLFDAGSVEIGPWAGFVRKENYATFLDPSVLESGGLVGVTLQGDLAENSALRVVPFVRLGAGVGFYGAKGTSPEGVVVVSAYGGLATVQVGGRIGLGALRR